MIPQHLKIHWIEFPKSRLTLGIVNVMIVALNKLTDRSKFSSMLDQMRDTMLGN